MTITELKEYIYKNNKIEYILNEIGCGHIQYHPEKEYYSCSNIDGDNRSAINIKNNQFLNCKNYTRDDFFDDKSDLLTLVQYNKKISGYNFSFSDTIKYLHKILGLPLTFSKTKVKERVDPLYIFKKIHRHKQNVFEINAICEDELLDFIPNIHIDLFKQGIMAWTIKKFGLAYSYKYRRNIIPLRYWLTGELLGFNMRTSIKDYDILGIKKYLITPNYPKSMNVFGLWENKENIEQAKYVVVYEAEKSVLIRDSLNDSTGVAISGHEISEEQAKILIGLNVEVIIALDKDINIEHIRYCCEKFYGIRKVSYIYDKWDLLDKKDSPVDKGNKIYNFLMKHRVVYDVNEHKKYLSSIKKGGN